MIELTFDPSFAATLANTHLNGVARQVIALPPDLQFGDLQRITGETADFYAFKAAHFSLGRDRGEPTAQTLQQADDASIHQLQQVVINGAELRLWWTDVPNDVIGLCWLSQQLCGVPIDVETIHVPTSLPRYTEDNSGKLYQINHLGELDPDWLGELIPTATPLNSWQMAGYRFEWRRLLDENAPLRALINGQLVSLPADFYDRFILAEAHSKPTSFAQQLRLIGQLIGQYPLGVPDWWWSARIDHLFA